jgi:chorismate lyase / 3-hydroxybenzoate synthase
MSTASRTSRKPAAAATVEPERSDLGVPPWVGDLLARAGAREVRGGSAEVRVVESSAFALLTVCKRDATALDSQAFESCTRDAYTAIAARLRDCAARHPVRFWNYIPDIHRPCGEGLDRYMCFNAGRFAACSDWLGGPDTFHRLLATGSGVGHGGQDLVIHALAAAVPGTAVENPRQIPAYRYSRRFGPRPPCFARATVVREAGRGPFLLVGGTASIRGEESVNVSDLRGQTLETFENLASLVRSACGTDDGLGAFRELRVYHFRETDRPAIAKLVEDAFPALDRVEYLRADLCRPELSVEIEGVAELKSVIRYPQSAL